MGDYFKVSVVVYAEDLPDAVTKVVYADGEPMQGLVSVSAEREPNR